ncbi:MAG: hypothetical protein KAV00_05535 [Phycisphaerae bacterium]|nr:hypothetical protein [Phycisphaerae bacterium]
MKILPDYSERAVRLTEERLKHILAHPEMAEMGLAVEATLREPEKVIQSRTDASVALCYRYYYGTIVGDKWLCVVVKYTDDDAFIITAYLTDTVKQGDLLWPGL